MDHKRIVKRFLNQEITYLQRILYSDVKYTCGKAFQGLASYHR